MFDGIIRTLIDVRYVPKLKKKLISLGVLDSCGHKFIGLSGVLKVSKGANLSGLLNVLLTGYMKLCSTMFS